MVGAILNSQKNGSETEFKLVYTHYKFAIYIRKINSFDDLGEIIEQETELIVIDDDDYDEDESMTENIINL